MTATSTATQFQGFPKELFTFLEELEVNNNKTYWESHRDVWENSVQEPVQALMSDLEVDFGPLRTFRPQRDVRFSKDKSPYKTWVGVTTSEQAVGGIGSFLRLEATGMRLAVGSMVMDPDQIKRFRAAVASDAAGNEFEEVTRQLAAKSLQVGPGRKPILQRTPAGFPKDHPREEILRWKGAVVIKEYKHANWLHGPKVIDTVRDVWEGAAPLIEWIETHVGHSEAPSRRPRR